MPIITNEKTVGHPLVLRSSVPSRLNKIIEAAVVRFHQWPTLKEHLYSA